MCFCENFNRSLSERNKRKSGNPTYHMGTIQMAEKGNSSAYADNYSKVAYLLEYIQNTYKQTYQTVNGLAWSKEGGLIKKKKLKIESTQRDSHLVVENSGFSRTRRRDQMLIYDSQNITANLRELILYLLAVTLNQFDIVLIPFRFFLLLNRRHNTPRSPPCAYDIFVSNREKVSLLHSQLNIKFCKFLHTLDHFWKIIFTQLIQKDVHFIKKIHIIRHNLTVKQMKINKVPTSFSSA